MAWIAGVDGCKGGWIAVYALHEDGELKDLECRVEEEFEDVMACPAPLDVVAVDMPIGLSEDGKRACDTAARRVLGKRHSSIFSAPAKEVIDCFRSVEAKAWKERGTYQRVNAKNGLSKQSYNLVPKIAEVARYVDTHRKEGRRIYEAHPEVSFAAMKANGGMIDPKRHPMQFHKATAGGSIERRELFTRVFEGSFQKLEGQLPELVGKLAALDDFYDALACLWTARRIQKGTEGPARALCGVKDLRNLDIRKLSESAPKGADGLPMRIVY